jgi:hypothetical protein
MFRAHHQPIIRRWGECMWQMVLDCQRACWNRLHSPSWCIMMVGCWCAETCRGVITKQTEDKQCIVLVIRMYHQLWSLYVPPGMWSIYVPPVVVTICTASCGHYMYWQLWSLYVQPIVVTICTASCGHYMNRQFNIQQFYVLPTQCVYVFCVDLRINSDYFPIQLTGFYNRDGVFTVRYGLNV